MAVMCVFAGVLSAGEPASGAPQSKPTLTIESAVAGAAKWIRSSAMHADGGTTWPADPGDPKSTNTSLYAGSPGVVLFFLELHHAGDKTALAEARDGADHLLTVIDRTSSEGLYTGLAGVGFTLGQVHRATNEAKYRDGVARVVAQLKARAKPAGAGIEWSGVTDIVGGAAGAGVFLLQAADLLNDPSARDLAVKAGRRLIEAGMPDHGGLKWGMSPQVARLMPNFAHGTAGIAYFLASLYKVTKEQAFLDGALAGARYLLAVAKTEGDMCLIFHHEPEEDGKNLFYLSWCHGPAGTARLWYQLFKVTGDAKWLAWTEASARAILASGIPERRTAGFWNNVSQCCGSAGVAAFFLEVHRATGKREYLAFSRRVTAEMLTRATTDASGTRWVQAEHRVRPELLIAQTGWMQGAAGIGAWLLRLKAFDEGRDAFVTLPDNPF
jgi:lantibiotic modifying enzyme